MKPLSLHATLAAYNLLRDTFAQSALFKDIVERVKDGSLYLPPPGYTTRSASLSRLAVGYMSEFHLLDLSVYLDGYVDENDEEYPDKHVSTYVSLPITVADGYTMKTEPYGHPTNKMTREVMTFTYSKRAFGAWVKKERVRLRSSRKETLTKERDKLNAQIKALS